MNSFDGLARRYYNSLLQSCCNTKIDPWFDKKGLWYKCASYWELIIILSTLFIPIISKTSDVSIPLKISNCTFVKHRASYITFNRIKFVSSMHEILNSDILKVILHIKTETNEWNVSIQTTWKIFVRILACS